MNFSKIQKLKLGVIKNWPLANKMRLAKMLLPNIDKKGQSLFKGISILNKEAILETDTHNYLEYSVFATGSYEHEIVSLIKSQLYNGQTALDIGANVGIHTVTMAKCVGSNGKVIAFEPIPFLRKKLKENLNLNNIQNTSLSHYALSDKKERVKVQFDPGAANLGTTSLGNSNQNGNEELEVEIGDDVLKFYQLATIDLIKIDVEGFELKVLNGLTRTIDQYHPRIIFEYDSNYIERISEKKEEVSISLFDFLSKRGYAVYFVQEQGIALIKSHKELPKSGNLFALHKSTN